MVHDDGQMIVRMHVPDEVTGELRPSPVVRKCYLEISGKVREPIDMNSSLNFAEEQYDLCGQEEIDDFDRVSTGDLFIGVFLVTL